MGYSDYHTFHGVAQPLDDHFRRGARSRSALDPAVDHPVRAAAADRDPDCACSYFPCSLSRLERDWLYVGLTTRGAGRAAFTASCNPPERNCDLCRRRARSVAPTTAGNGTTASSITGSGPSSRWCIRSYFLRIAMMGLQSPPKAGLLHRSSDTFHAADASPSFCVYLIVTSVLLILIALFALPSTSGPICLLLRQRRRRTCCAHLSAIRFAHVGPSRGCSCLATAVIDWLRHPCMRIRSPKR